MWTGGRSTDTASAAPLRFIPPAVLRADPEAGTAPIASFKSAANGSVQAVRADPGGRPRPRMGYWPLCGNQHSGRRAAIVLSELGGLMPGKHCRIVHAQQHARDVTTARIACI